VLAAVGTALRDRRACGGDCVGGRSEGARRGHGGILGAPFMLATLAFAITGVAAYVFARAGRRARCCW